MNYLISIPAGGYKCCAGIGIAIEISKLLSKIKSNVIYAGVSSGACIAFIMCHNSSYAYKLKVIKEIVKLETSSNNIFIQLDKIKKIFQQMLLPNKNDYLQFNNRLHIGLMFNFRFTIISNFSSNDNLLDILIASITLFPLTYDIYQYIDIYKIGNDKSIKGIAFDGAYSTKRVIIDTFATKTATAITNATATTTKTNITTTNTAKTTTATTKTNTATTKTTRYIYYTFDYDEIGITDEYFLNKKDYNVYKKLFLFGQRYVKNNYNAIKKKLKLT